MRHLPVVAIVSLVAAGCGKSAEECRETQQRCDAIANDIRRAAAQRGVESQGICSSSNPQIQRDFGNACQKLRECNDEVAECD